MKKILLILIMCYTAHVAAQDVRFSAYLYTEPQHYLSNNTDALIHFNQSEERFNIGLGIDYQKKIMYFDADIYLFPSLNDVDYFHFQSTLLGFNHHSVSRKWRIKLGVIKPGLINRGWTHLYPMVGSDFGIEYYFDKRFYIGIEVSGDWRTDDKYWSSNATGYYQVNSGFKTGFYW